MCKHLCKKNVYYLTDLSRNWTNIRQTLKKFLTDTLQNFAKGQFLKRDLTKLFCALVIQTKMSFLQATSTDQKIKLLLTAKCSSVRAQQTENWPMRCRSDKYSKYDENPCLAKNCDKWVSGKNYNYDATLRKIFDTQCKNVPKTTQFGNIVELFR